MRFDLGLKEDNTETNYWIPVSNILAAALLVLLVVFVAGMIYFKSAAADPQMVANQPAGTQSGVNQPAGTQQPASSNDAQTTQASQAAGSVTKEQQAAIAELAGIRSAIITDLDTNIGKLGLKLEIDKSTGNVRFNEAVLFDVNKTTVSKDGGEYLKKFIPAYLSVLMSDRYRGWIDQIIIEGHADDGGSYQYNLDLSQQRANAVANYVISNNLSKLSDGTDVKKILSISGRSYSVPVMNNETIDKARSRRVEFAFHLKDAEMDRQIQDILKGVGK